MNLQYKAPSSERAGSSAGGGRLVDKVAAGREEPSRRPGSIDDSGTHVFRHISIRPEHPRTSVSAILCAPPASPKFAKLCST